MGFHHFCISVSNLTNSINFYESHFGFIEDKRYIGEGVVIIFGTLLGSLKFEILCFDGSNYSSFDRIFGEDLKNNGLKHIAFCCEENEFDTIYTLCKYQNIIYEDLKTRNLVQKNFYIKDPDGIVLEFLVE